MKTMKAPLAALLASLLILSPAGCQKGGGKVDIPANQTGGEDFQRNLHQYIRQDHCFSFVETDAGYYFVSYGTLYFLEKETGRTTVVCAKPDCDHTDDSICNARIHARYLLSGGETLNFVAFGSPKTVKSVDFDATELKGVQELKFNETSSSQSSYDQAIYHRGYIYYVSDDILYRAALGGEKDSAEIIWGPENAGETQMQNGMQFITGSEIHYTLWAEGDIVYFMVNLQAEDGTLFACDLTDMSVTQVWITPDKKVVGEWERTGVKVNQWYITGGYIYFYLAGNGLWRTELASGKTEKSADTSEKIPYGSAVISDDYICIMNDVPKFNEFATEPRPGSPNRYDADTIFLYGLDGTFIKEIPLKPLYDEMGRVTMIDLLMCDSAGLYFVTTAYTYGDPNDTTLATGRALTLCRANFETGEVTQLYKLG